MKRMIENLANVSSKKSNHSRSNFSDELPLVNREEEIIKIWKLFEENYLQTDNVLFKGSCSILSQTFGSGKTALGVTVFSDTKQEELLEKFPSLPGRIRTIYLDMRSVRKYGTSLEISFIELVLRSYWSSEKFCNEDISRCVIIDLPNILEGLTCIIVDEIDHIELLPKKYFDETDSQHMMYRYYQFLNLIAPVVKKIYFILCGKSMELALIGHGLYRGNHIDSPFDIVHCVLNPLNPKHLEELVRNLKLNDGTEFCSTIDLNDGEVNLFIDALWKYTAGVPRLVQYSLKYIYLNGKWDSSDFDLNSDLTKEVRRSPGFGLNIQPKYKEHVIKLINSSIENGINRTGSVCVNGIEVNQYIRLILILII